MKANDDLELLKTIRTKFVYCDNIIMLDNGLVLGKNNSVGEIFTLNLESEELNELQAVQGDNIT